MATTAIVSFPMSEKKKSEVFNRIYKDERKGLLAFIRKRVDDVDEAEDILQDVFVRLYNSMDLIDSLEKVVSWLFTVTRNRITDSYRKKRPETRDLNDTAFGELTVDDSDSEMNSDSDLIWESLTEAIEQLPEEQKEAYLLHEFEGLSIKEIAEVQGVTQNTVLSRKRYAVLRLRELLKEIYQEIKE